MTDDTQHLARQVARIRDQIAAIGAARPTPEQLDAEDDADRIMAQRIHHARPGIPLHHVAAVLQVLRAVQEMDPPAPAVSEAEAALRDVLAQFDGIRNSDGLGDIQHYQARATPREYARWQEAAGPTATQATQATEPATWLLEGTRDLNIP